MILDMVKDDAGAQPTGAHVFQVGNFALHLKRTLEETRKRLGLSNREAELLRWISAGLKKREIAEKMGVTPATADTFRRRAYAKLGVGTGAAAVGILNAYLAGAEIEARSRDQG
ncbi:MAG: helix-turn-helix transcriptional regulator [Henriciella sp.]